MSDVRVVAKFVPADEQRGKLAHWAYWFEWEEADGTPARQRYPAEVPLDVAEAIIADGSSALRAREAGLAVLAFPADWSRGPRAGPERNQRMLDETHPALVVAFRLPVSRGTDDMVRRARSHGVRTVVVSG